MLVCTAFTCSKGNPYWKYTGKIVYDKCPECGQPLREITVAHGGARPGAGRKPRKDDRAGRLVRIWLTDQEHLNVLTLSTDERREALLRAIKEKSQ